jgi:tRNA(fMet)-specific endonuclease VapC
MRLLDTNICVYAIRRRPEAVYERLARAEADGVALSVITALELQVGALRAAGQRYATMVAEFLAEFDVLPLDDAVREAYARERVSLERRGERIGAHDILIAAHAIALGATLVTNNEREFRRVKGLRVENWIGKD